MGLFDFWKKQTRNAAITETTKPAEPVPTGDSSLVFAAIAIISLVGVATIAKRREN